MGEDVAIGLVMGERDVRQVSVAGQDPSHRRANGCGRDDGVADGLVAVTVATAARVDERRHVVLVARRIAIAGGRGGGGGGGGDGGGGGRDGRAAKREERVVR